CSRFHANLSAYEETSCVTLSLSAADVPLSPISILLMSKELMRCCSTCAFHRCSSMSQVFSNGNVAAMLVDTGAGAAAGLVDSGAAAGLVDSGAAAVAASSASGACISSAETPVAAVVAVECCGQVYEPAQLLCPEHGVVESTLSLRPCSAAAAGVSHNKTDS